MKHTFADIRQRGLSQFIINLKRFQPEEWETMEELPMILYYDVFTQSAENAGWFETLEVDKVETKVDDLTYPQTVELAQAVAEKYTELTALDPN